MLALGYEEWTHTIRQALPHRQKIGFVDAHNFWGLCALPEPVSVDVAAIHHSFALGDLRYAAEYIRRRWPDALILVIGDQAKYLDDPLYDDWASGEISPEELLGHIDRLLAARRRIRKSDRPWLGGVRQ